MINTLLRLAIVSIVALNALGPAQNSAANQEDLKDCAEIGPLLRRLSSEDGNERHIAKKELLDFSERSPASRQCLITTLLKTVSVSDSGHELMRSQERFREWSEATDLLGRMEATEALDILISCLDCNDGRFGLSLGRFPAALAVMRYGETAVPKLSAALRHKNPMIRHKAVEVLYAMGGDRAKQEVKKAVPYERVRWIADAMNNMLRTWHDRRINQP